MFYAFNVGNEKNVHWSIPTINNAMPLTAISDSDKLVVAYDNNKIVVFDTQNKEMHSWSKKNIDKFPKNYLNRFNRIIGLVKIS
jgi:hypothetical protein